MSSSIWVIPRNGQGHLFPCMELCKHLLLRNYHITLVVDSDISSSVPLSLLQSPLFHLAVISSSSPGSDPFHRFHEQMTQGIESLLTGGSSRPVCAVIDHIMSKTQEVFWKFNIPTVIFITSSACWASVQHAAWIVGPGDMKPGEVRPLPELPEGMVLSYSDLKQRRPWMPPPSKPGSGDPVGDPESGLKRPRGPPLPGEPAPWVEEVKNSSAILFNTCDEIERVFLEYVSNLTRKPVFGVGPLLPEQYWKSTDSTTLHDREIRIRPGKESNYTEDQIIEWLDSKPRGSVLYVSFGSEVSPTVAEYEQLAKALEESTRPFIWVIQRGGSGKKGPGGQPGSETAYFPHGLSEKVGKRGLIIYGWAPQLLILSHESRGGFVSHCGWNSTAEGIVRGVPFLAWPIRGDQYYNAKLVVSCLKIGVLVAEDYPAEMVKKDDILKGMECVFSDEGIRMRAKALGDKFVNGFPKSSLASLDAFSDFLKQKDI